MMVGIMKIGPAGFIKPVVTSTKDAPQRTPKKKPMPKPKHVDTEITDVGTSITHIDERV